MNTASTTSSEKCIQTIDALQPLLADANHVDIKAVEGNVTMREFIASMLAYQPGWVTFLYHVRGVFVRFLGMKQEGIPGSPKMSADTVPMKPGENATFFTVRYAKEDKYWVVDASESHLTATLGIVVEALKGEKNRFHVVTIVHYHNWAGPIYFNVIRPFHHLVVRNMIQAGIKPASR